MNPTLSHLIVPLVALWLVSGALSYGLLYPFFRHVADHRPSDEASDHTGSIVLSIGGPLSLLIAIVLSEGGKHGLSWQRLDRLP